LDAVDEGDWERLREYDFESIERRSKKLPKIFHPPIDPELAAKKLRSCIKKKDKECAFREISALLFVANEE